MPFISFFRQSSLPKKGDESMTPRIEAAERMALFAREGRLIQGEWQSDHDGHELACLLGAISSDVTSPDDCPANVMPAWLAHLLPLLFDNVRGERAVEFGLRFAQALRAGPVDDSVRDRWLVRVVEFAEGAAAAAAAAAAADAAADADADAEAAAAAAREFAEGAAAEAAAAAEAEAEAVAAAYAADAAANAAAVAARAEAWNARANAFGTMFNWLIEEMKA
jgi:hypothetical protein